MELNDKQLTILAAAEKLFSTMGFDGTSVRDISTEAGVNVAMISYYFGSKEKLMEAIFERNTYKMRLKMETMLQNDKMSNYEKVNILIEDYVEKFLTQPQFHKLMLREQLADKPGGVTGRITELKMRNYGQIRKLIQDGQKSGEFRKSIDISLMMATMVGTVSQIIISERFYRTAHNLEDRSREEFNAYMQKKLNNHLKNLFKLVLTNEAK